MRFRLLCVFGGLVVLSSLATAAEVTCQSVLSVGDGNFAELETAGSCDIGNVTFSNFNTTFTATSVLVSTNGFAGSPVGAILGLTYSFLNGSFPGGNIGYTATFDPTASTDGAGGTACPAAHTCGITGSESQLNSGEPVPNGAIVSTVDSGGYSATTQVDALTLGDETSQTTFAMIVAPTGITKLATYNGLGIADTFSTEVITGQISGVPEPTSILLVGVGLIGVALIKRKAIRQS
jgi:hypothetical protein